MCVHIFYSFISQLILDIKNMKRGKRYGMDLLPGGGVLISLPWYAAAENMHGIKKHNQVLCGCSNSCNKA